jgi:enterochelin esterase-like enzyme
MSRACPAPRRHPPRGLLLGGAALLSLLVAPAAPGGQAIPSGHVSATTIHDRSYGRERRLWVYTPAGYDVNRPQPYPLLIAFDGDTYRSDDMPLPATLDALAARGDAPAFVAVLVDDGSGAVRLADLANVSRFATFMADDLVPWIRRGWHVTRDPHRVLVTGSSAGGLGAAFVALTRPDLIGNVWSQSGAFWRGAEASNDPPWEWLTSQVASRPKADVRFVLDVGSLEDHATLGGSGPNFLAATRRFKDTLLATTPNSGGGRGSAQVS